MCFNMQTSSQGLSSFMFVTECTLMNKEFDCSRQCRTLMARANAKVIYDLSHFKLNDVVVWSSVRPEHQNLIVGMVVI